MGGPIRDFFFSVEIEEWDRRMLNGRGVGWSGSEDWTLLGYGGRGRFSVVRGRGLGKHRVILRDCCDCSSSKYT